jgi:ABC-type transport system involved in multi-copper enzyme maturation permease subunit
MTRLVKSEILKLRTTRTFWGLVIVTAGLVVLVTVLTLALDSHLSSEEDVRSLLSTAGITGLFMLILGVVFSAGEYRHGTIASTLLVTPTRTRVVVAKALACATTGVLVGGLIAGVTAVIALPWLAGKDVTPMSTGELLGLFFGGVLYTALACSFGAGVGALMRNQAAAVTVVLVLLLVVDPAVAALAEGYERFSLAGLGTTLSGAPAENLGSGDPLPFGVAALLWTIYTSVMLMAAAVVMSRRDI